jgi:DNA-binding CsgD family transcriptional regulator
VIERLWDEDVLRTLTDALHHASSGSPTVLVIEGEPGVGKSSLLDELVARAVDFTVATAETYETTAATPYALLARWGVDLKAAESPSQAAQRLRERVDAMANDGPVLLIIDDLQWADPESTQAVVELLTRLAGDPLLLAVAGRPYASDAHAAWQRWSSRPDRVTRIDLTGLPLAAVSAFIASCGSNVDAATAEALWHHTSGNPLFLAGLLAEYEPLALAQMRVLPAPEAFRRTVAATLERLPEPARNLIEALAVLGSDWVPLFDAGEVARVADVVAAAQTLVDERLVQLRQFGAGQFDAAEAVRVQHALIRAAVYQSLPIVVRKQLHARAAAVVRQRADVLEHRLAAVGDYDEDLAADLSAYATHLHGAKSYRLAAHYWRAASAVTPALQQREQRWLESLFDTLMSGDRTAVHAELPQVAAAFDAARGGFIAGTLASWSRRPHEAVAVLAPLVEGPQVAMDSATRYRVEVVLAWSRLISGQSEELVWAGLQRAAPLEPKDPALTRLELLAAAQLSRRSGREVVLPGFADLPQQAAAVAVGDTGLLAVRGAFRRSIGDFGGAIADLGEIVDRVQRGLADVGSGSYHAMLGSAQWFFGDWSLARVNTRLAVDLSGDYLHPVVASLAPLSAIGDGQFADADELLARGRAILDHAPWPEAVDYLTISAIIKMHAEGRCPPDFYEHLRDDVAAVVDGRIRKSPVWLMHVSLAAIWAGALNDAATCAAAVRSVGAELGWSASVAEWLHGLVAEARGQGKIALGHLRAAVADANTSLPLYGGHMLVDHARLAALLGDSSTAAHSLNLAAEVYDKLGAQPWLGRVEQLRDRAEPRSETPGLNLSERELDIVTLVMSGMSYAQIARQLFITQSTVSYHLGHIYAKANVSSRHQLTSLAREQPAALGLRVAVS